MKKIFKIILVLTLTICASFTLVACGGEKDFEPVLKYNYSINGFRIQATEDFVLNTTADGISLKSEGDNQVSFGDTWIFGQYDCGNDHYSFENTTISQYANDIAKIEDVTLPNPSTITIKEKFTENSAQDLVMNMYVIDKMSNPNGNWDYYEILCIGKAENSFVYFNIYTSIQDAYYEDNIEKYNAIIGSVEFTQPTNDNSYNDSAKSYMSSTMVNTGDFWDYYNFKMDVPYDYQKTEYENANWYNYLNTAYDREDWGSAIYIKTLESFMGDAILADNGSKHLINFSTSNLLGFYTKNIDSEVSANRQGYYYNIYFLDAENNLSRNYFQVHVGWNEELDSLGFGNYFEEQMLSWMQSVEITEDN